MVAPAFAYRTCRSVRAQRYRALMHVRFAYTPQANLKFSAKRLG
jgi:hypothetical protein